MRAARPQSLTSQTRYYDITARDARGQKQIVPEAIVESPSKCFCASNS